MPSKKHKNQDESIINRLNGDKPSQLKPRPDMNTRIYGGENTEYGDFPFAVSIQTKDQLNSDCWSENCYKHRCGGSIINLAGTEDCWQGGSFWQLESYGYNDYSEWILTSAECVQYWLKNGSDEMLKPYTTSSGVKTYNSRIIYDHNNIAATAGGPEGKKRNFITETHVIPTYQEWTCTPGYQTGPPTSRVAINDFALLKLRDIIPTTDNDYSKAIPITTTSDTFWPFTTEDIHFVGWGQSLLNWDDPWVMDDWDNITNNMQYVEMDVSDFCGGVPTWWDGTTCGDVEIDGQTGFPHDYVICAGGYYGGTLGGGPPISACPGDEGGPLFVDSNILPLFGEWTQIGVYSFGFKDTGYGGEAGDCYTGNYPGGFSRITEYVCDWISDKLAENPPYISDCGIGQDEDIFGQCGELPPDFDGIPCDVAATSRSNRNVLQFKDCCGNCFTDIFGSAGFLYHWAMAKYNDECFDTACGDTDGYAPNLFCAEYNWSYCNCNCDDLTNETDLNNCEYDCEGPDDGYGCDTECCGETCPFGYYCSTGGYCYECNPNGFNCCDMPSDQYAYPNSPETCPCFGQCLDQPVEGCLNPNACNYNPAATYGGYNEAYGCLFDYDCAGVCGGNLTVDICGHCGGTEIDFNNCACGSCSGTYTIDSGYHCYGNFCSYGGSCQCDDTWSDYECNNLWYELYCQENENNCENQADEWGYYWHQFSSCSSANSYGSTVCNFLEDYDGWTADCNWVTQECICSSATSQYICETTYTGCTWGTNWITAECGPEGANFGYQECIDNGCTWASDEADCNGVCGGSAVEDSCGICGGDCWDGFDACGVCCGTAKICGDGLYALDGNCGDSEICPDNCPWSGVREQMTDISCNFFNQPYDNCDDDCADICGAPECVWSPGFHGTHCSLTGDGGKCKCECDPQCNNNVDCTLCGIDGGTYCSCYGDVYPSCGHIEVLMASGYFRSIDIGACIATGCSFANLPVSSGSWTPDGMCDPNCNNAACGYDLGDCCQASCGATLEFRISSTGDTLWAGPVEMYNECGSGAGLINFWGDIYPQNVLSSCDGCITNFGAGLDETINCVDECVLNYANGIQPYCPDIPECTDNTGYYCIDMEYCEFELDDPDKCFLETCCDGPEQGASEVEVICKEPVDSFTGSDRYNIYGQPCCSYYGLYDCYTPGIDPILKKKKPLSEYKSGGKINSKYSKEQLLSMSVEELEQINKDFDKNS